MCLFDRRAERGPPEGPPSPLPPDPSRVDRSIVARVCGCLGFYSLGQIRAIAGESDTESDGKREGRGGGGA